MSIYQFRYQTFDTEDQLEDDHKKLLLAAKNVTDKAYAPYSKFLVGAAVLLQNQQMVTGVNIENASYPVGICAERAALASAISQYPDEKILAIAISYLAPSGNNDKPAFPCGMCRQFISECEDRNHKPIQLILAGKHGKIILIETSKDLLPFSFSGNDLG